MLRVKAPDNVSRPTRRKGHNHLDRLARIVIGGKDCLGSQDCQAEQSGDEQARALQTAQSA